MPNLTPLYGLSIAGRLTLEMHSLNNEGGEGNQITTRMVTLVDKHGEPFTVNAISGDMFKHIHAKHLQRLAKSCGLNLCAACKEFKASRISDDPEFAAKVLEKKTIKGAKKDKKVPVLNDSQVIDLLLRTCVVDDAEGNLIAPSQKARGRGKKEDTAKSDEEQVEGGQAGRSVPRKSVAEFGWVVGLPGTKTESHFHVRYASERGGEEDTSQPIFHRPASSGVYAVVASFEIARLGFNDIVQKYPDEISDDERLARHRTFLESTLHTFVDPAGAMRSTQNPHIFAFEGVVTTSTSVMPAPLLSPLNASYREEIERVAKALDGQGAVKVQRFETMGGFAETMRDLVNSTRPYKLFAE